MTSTVIDPTLWLRRFHPAPQAPVRLICFPHAGGSASYFFPVSRALTPGIEVQAVQYPGRQDRRTETPIGDVEQLADHIATALRPALDRPVALFGHSLGAMVEFEVARRLENDGHELLGVFASGRRAPDRYRDESVHTLPDSALIANMKELSGTDPRLLGDAEFLQSVLPALRADYHAAETYRCRDRAPLRCPIVTLTGDQDPMVSAAEAQGWAAHTAGEFQLHTFPGGHFYLDQHVPAVLGLIAEQLTRWRDRK
ncbi:alpha/beta fold hydrolase [Nocardia sp. NPDC051030]|uniref:thioesterase II family protein n=1 Tax=Nocardia sp. NPDC051030 TaxID=3155162 RepID=UPI00343DBB30